MIAFRIGPPIQEPRDKKGAQDLAEDQKQSERFVTLAGVDHAYEQNRQANLTAKHREHVSPDSAEWPKRDLPTLQRRKELRYDPSRHEKIHHPHWPEMPLVQNPKLFTRIDLHRDRVPAKRKKSDCQEEQENFGPE